MVTFFQSIYQFFVNAFLLIGNLLKSGLKLIQVTNIFSGLPAQLVSSVPSFLGLSITAVVAVAIIKLVVGRDNP